MGKTGPVNDSVFDTKFTKGMFSWGGEPQGGARPLGNNVWIGASGKAEVGFEIVDAKGDASQIIPYEAAYLYDPFVRIVDVEAVATPTDAMSASIDALPAALLEGKTLGEQTQNPQPDGGASEPDSAHTF